MTAVRAITRVQDADDIAISGDLHFNVKAYGAKGDNSTDDTTAIQNAVNAAVAVSGRIYFPAGAYKITAAITVPAGAQYKIEGESRGSTVIRQFTDNTPIFQFTASSSAYGFTVSGITLTWNNAQMTTLNGAINNSQTTITVASTTPFGAVNSTGVCLVVDRSTPTAPVNGEQMSYTVASATTLTVTRGANGSTAAAHVNGSSVIPVGATLACGLYFNGSSSAQFYNWVMQDIRFTNGSYLISHAGGTTQAVWGITVRDVDVHSAVGGVWNAPTPFTGSPNDKFENVYVYADVTTGPLWNLAGVNQLILNGIEINQSWLGPTIVSLTGGAVIIGSLKTELGLYDGTWCSGGLMTGALFTIPSVQFVAQYLKLQGLTMNTTGMSRPYVFDLSGATLAGTPVQIGALDLTGDSGWTVNPSVSYFVGAATSTTGGILIQKFQPSGINLLNASIAGADQIAVAGWNNGFLSADKGDANYTFAFGDPTVISYETPLAIADRTVTLPDQVAAGSTNLFNGLTITVARTASGGKNLIVQRGSTVLDTIAAPTNGGSTSTVTYVYRRGKWVRTVKALN